MKHFLYIIVVALSLTMTSCVTTLSTQRINRVEVGMTRENIRHLLGTPEFKNGNLDGEQWGYHLLVGEIAGPEERLFLVTFDANGRVVDYRTINDRPHHHMR